MRQLTLRGFDRRLDRRIREIAREEGLSLNQAALKLLREGAGLAPSRSGSRTVGHSLDFLVGTWSEEDAREFERVTRDHERIDRRLWR